MSRSPTRIIGPCARRQIAFMLATRLAGTAEHRPLPLRQLRTGRVRTAAGDAFVGASLDREHRGDRITPPAVEGQRTFQIAVTHHHLDHQIGPQIDVVEASSARKAWGLTCTPARILPREIRDLVEGSAIPQREEQLMQRRLGAVAAQHEIHLRIGDQLAVKIRRGQAAHDHGYIGVYLLHDARHFQRAVGVRQPMQVDADRLWASGARGSAARRSGGYSSCARRD